MTELRVAAREVNEVAFCALKLALTEKYGDRRTPERERGRRLHQDVGSAVEESSSQTCRFCRYLLTKRGVRHEHLDPR